MNLRTMIADTFAAVLADPGGLAVEATHTRPDGTTQAVRGVFNPDPGADEAGRHGEDVKLAGSFVTADNAFRPVQGRSLLTVEGTEYLAERVWRGVLVGCDLTVSRRRTAGDARR